MPVLLGASQARGTVALQTRNFYIATELITVPDNTVDLATWEYTAGTKINLIYSEVTSGLNPPNRPQLLQIGIYAETDTGAFWRTLYDDDPRQAGAAGLNHGDTLSFWATDDNTANGNPICGTFRLYVRAFLQGLLGYDGNSDTTTGVFDQGVIRINSKLDLEHGGYPAGTNYAYGAAAAEFVTARALHAQKIHTGTHQEIRLDILDGAAVHASGSTQTFTGTSTEEQTEINTSNFDDLAKTYGVRATPIGNALLVPNSGAILWNSFVADIGTVKNGDAVEDQTVFDADPRIHLVSVTPGETLYNRGEASTLSLVVANSRNENLTRSMTVQLLDSTPAIKFNQALTGSPYVVNYTILSADDAALDLVGKQWTWDFGSADVTNISGNAFKVSFLLLLNSIQVVSQASNNLIVNADHSIYNRGESPILNYFLGYARGDALASIGPIDQIIYDLVDAVEDTQVEFTDAVGRVDTTYTIDPADTATNDAVGSPKHLDVSWEGNLTLDSADMFTVSSLYLIDLHPQLAGVLNKDNFPNEDVNEDYSFVILGNIAYVWVHIAGIRQDGTEIDTSGNGITIQRFDPDTALVDTTQVDTGPDGWSSRVDFSVGTPAGGWVYEADVNFLGNTATTNHAITHITPLTANLHTMLKPPAELTEGVTQRWYYRTEEDDIAEPPQTLPVWKLYEVDGNGVWQLALSGNMTNVVDDTETINGAHYYFDMETPAAPETYVLWTQAQLNGNGIRYSQSFEVTQPFVVNEYDFARQLLLVRAASFDNILQVELLEEGVAKLVADFTAYSIDPATAIIRVYDDGVEVLNQTLSAFVANGTVYEIALTDTRVHREVWVHVPMTFTLPDTSTVVVNHNHFEVIGGQIVDAANSKRDHVTVRATSFNDTLAIELFDKGTSLLAAGFTTFAIDEATSTVLVADDGVLVFSDTLDNFTKVSTAYTHVLADPTDGELREILITLKATDVDATPNITFDIVYHDNVGYADVPINLTVTKTDVLELPDPCTGKVQNISVVKDITT